MCNIYNKSKTSSHLFVTCQATRRLLNKCERWLRFQFVHHLAKEHVLGFGVFGGGRNGSKLWRVLWMVIVWSIWKMRNDIVFKSRSWEVVEAFL